MKYLLDTNICIYIIKKKPIKVFKKLESLDISEVGISSITLSELQYGVHKSAQKERNQIALMQFIAPLTILPFDNKAANIYGKIRAELEKKGNIIGPLDLLIGAHAYSYNLILVTNNEKEFIRINGLNVENWIKT